MATSRFGGPLASEFAAFAATLEASATANKTTLTQLRALDRFTAQRSLPSGTIDETLAKAWLAGCVTRPRTPAPPATTCCAASAASWRPAAPARSCPASHFARAADRPSHPTSTPGTRCVPCLPARSHCGTGPAGHPYPIRSTTLHTLILLLATSGLRISEALHLTLADVDLTAGVLPIHQSKFRNYPGSCRSPPARWTRCAATMTGASLWHPPI